MFEHEILRLRCAQGAPLPNWDAGAEMKELGKSEAVCPTVEDPNKETDPERTKPTQHTGQGESESERAVTGKFFVYVWDKMLVFSFLMMSILPNVLQPCLSHSVPLGERDPGSSAPERERSAAQQNPGKTQTDTKRCEQQRHHERYRETEHKQTKGNE